MKAKLKTLLTKMLKYLLHLVHESSCDCKDKGTY